MVGAGAIHDDEGRHQKGAGTSKATGSLQSAVDGSLCAPLSEHAGAEMHRCPSVQAPPGAPAQKAVLGVVCSRLERDFVSDTSPIQRQTCTIESEQSSGHHHGC